jgi:hypothetical protein
MTDIILIIFGVIIGAAIILGIPAVILIKQTSGKNE